MPQPVEHLPYLRHRNGGGKLFDTSEACERSEVDRDSVVCEDASVWQSRVINSEIRASIVSGAVIRNSSILYTEGVHGATIEDSKIAAEFIGGMARIENCDILGKSRVAHFAKCESVSFKDLTVKGKAELRNWPDEFDGCLGYISRGLWLRPPRVIRLDFGVTVTESVDGHAFVACIEFSIDRWLRIGERYGRAQGWSPEQVDEVRQFLLTLQREPLPTS